MLVLRPSVCHLSPSSVRNVLWLNVASSSIDPRLDYGNIVFVGLPAYLQRLLLTILNAAASFVFRLRHYNHVSDALDTAQSALSALAASASLPERVNFELALMAYRVLNGLASPYLNQLVPVSSLPGCRRLLSLFMLQLHIMRYRLSTTDRRSFSVTTSIFLEHCQTTCSLAVYIVCLFLSTIAKDIRSFPDIIIYISLLCYRGLCNSLSCFSHAKIPS